MREILDYTTSRDSKKTLELDKLMLESESNIERISSFKEADIPEPVLALIEKNGWTTPTPVQAMCLNHTLSGDDVAGFAQTGTGKTGVFLITAASYLTTVEEKDDTGKGAAVKAVVLVPTRELAVQIADEGQKFFEPLGYKVEAVFGGMDYEKQEKKLRDGVDVIVATPGRFKDFYQKKAIHLKECGIFVCDEVDRMFDMGFIDDVEFFYDKLSEDCQKLIFSATTNPKVKELAFEYLENPIYVAVDPEKITPDTIDQQAIAVGAQDKLKVMLGLMKDHNPECAIIFTNTKLTAEWLHHKLIGNGVDADVITGDLPQKKRIALIKKINSGNIKALIATDVASRGLHISRISHVFNFDVPDDPANYVHRIGRTARAGAKGTSITLVCDDYGYNMSAIDELLGDYPPKYLNFDLNYLKIEDKSSNPFEAKESDSKDESRDSRPRGKNSKGPRDQNRRGDGQRKDHKGRDRNDRSKGRERNDRNKGRDRNDRNKDKNPNRNKNKGKNHHKKGDHKKTDQKNQPMDKKQPSLLKKIVKLFFK